MQRAALLPALLLAASGCATAPAREEAVLPSPGTPPAMPTVPPGMQFLYGSGEAAALSIQAYNAMVGYVRDVLDAARNRAGRLPHQRGPGTSPRWPASAILAPGSTAASASGMPCGASRPPAVVFDMDETLVLNLGYEANDARTGLGYDAKRWEQWERTGADKVTAVPGAVAAFRQFRAMGVTIIVNTNRSAQNAAFTEQALANAGLGTFTHGETLFLKGDVDGKPGKDARRWEIAKRYCVVALAGDQLGDFADLFNPPGQAPALGRRMLPGTTPLMQRWGRGWFVLPNPVYGTGLGTDWDETFPTDKRWSPAP